MNITGYTNSDYWGFLPLTDSAFKQIVLQGGVDESFIID